METTVTNLAPEGARLNALKTIVHLLADRLIITACKSRSAYFERDLAGMQRQYDKHKDYKVKHHPYRSVHYKDSYDMYILGQMKEALECQLAAERELVKVYSKILRQYRENLSASVSKSVASSKGKSLAKCKAILNHIRQLKKEGAS